MMIYIYGRWKKVGQSESEAESQNMKCIRATKDSLMSTGSDVVVYGRMDGRKD